MSSFPPSPPPALYIAIISLSCASSDGAGEELGRRGAVADSVGSCSFVVCYLLDMKSYRTTIMHAHHLTPLQGECKTSAAQGELRASAGLPPSSSIRHVFRSLCQRPQGHCPPGPCCPLLLGPRSPLCCCQHLPLRSPVRRESPRSSPGPQDYSEGEPLSFCLFYYRPRVESRPSSSQVSATELLPARCVSWS